jgi:hypothetical protein
MSVDAVLAHGERVEGRAWLSRSRQGGAADKFAIGYFGIGYLMDGVHAVPLAATLGGQCQDTSPEATYSGAYPLARYLYIYLNVSRDGQVGTVKSGFYPIPNSMRLKDLSTMGVSTDVNEPQIEGWSLVGSHSSICWRAQWPFFLWAASESTRSSIGTERRAQLGTARRLA